MLANFRGMDILARQICVSSFLPSSSIGDFFEWKQFALQKITAKMIGQPYMSVKAMITLF